MDKRAAVVLAVVFGGLFLMFLAFLGVAYLAVRDDGGPTLGGTRVGVVEVLGVIEDTSAETKALHKFTRDDSIKAIVVRVDSPGGAVGPSQEVHRAIIRAREKKKVVVSMGTLAASGGYYISVAADKIFANAGTITASIGVISQFPYFGELIDWAKVDYTVIKTGALKDAGSPLRRMEENERAYFQGLVDDIFEQFVNDVATGRKLEVDKVKAVADGRVLTGKQALDAGLVDAIGNFYDAVEEAKKLAGIEGEARLVYPEKEERFPFRALFEDAGKAFARGAVPRPAEGLLMLWPGWRPE